MTVRRAPRFEVERRRIEPREELNPKANKINPVRTETGVEEITGPLAAEIAAMLRDRPLRFPRELIEGAAR